MKILFYVRPETQVKMGDETTPDLLKPLYRLSESAYSWFQKYRTFIIDRCAYYQLIVTCLSSKNMNKDKIDKDRCLSTSVNL